MGSRVLLVDDHAAFRAAAQALLQAEGFDVVADVGTAIEALKAVRRHHPDVVLLDVRLPDEDGITLAGHLAVLHPRRRWCCYQAGRRAFTAVACGPRQRVASWSRVS